MNRHLIRFVSCLLVPAFIGADPAWAAMASAHQPRPRATSAASPFWSTQACNAPLVDAWVGHEESTHLLRQEGELSRRELGKVSLWTLLAGLLFGGRANAQTATARVTIEQAQAYGNLQGRFLDNSQTLVNELSKIDAAERHVRAMASRNVWLTFNMDDANRAPRESLTSGLPTVKDVVGRIGLAVDGPLNRVESLHPQVDKHWGKLGQNLKTIARLSAQGLKTLFLRGGWTLNSASQVLLGQVEYYLANIDLASTDAMAFEALESEWLKIQPAWFDLVLRDVTIRQNRMTERYAAKLKARQRALLPVDAKRADHKADARTAAIQAAIQKIESDIRVLRQEQIQLEGQQQANANTIVLGELRGVDADGRVADASATYRPLAPDIRPTLGFVQRVLLSAGERIDPAALRAFNNVLSKEGAPHGVAADPFSLDSRTWILDQAWGVSGNRASIPEPEIPRDSQLTTSLEKQNELLALTPGKMALLAKPSPEQTRLVFAVRRILELSNALLLQKLPRWTLRIFGKLGLDLPIQVAFNNQTLGDDARTTLLKEEQEALIPGVEAMMVKAQHANEAHLLQVRNELATARKALLEAARQSARLIDQLRNAFEVDLGVEGLAYDFERQLFIMEKSALEAEKAYQKILYLTQGRTELRRLFEQRRDAYLEARRKSASPPTATPEKPADVRKDMELPEAAPAKPSKGRRLAFSRAAWTVALGMFVSMLGQAAEIGKPLYQSAVAPHWSTWLLVVASLAWTIVAPHFVNDRYNHGPNRFILWVGFPMAIVVVLCPFGWVAGANAAGIAGLLAWQFRRKSLTVHRPYSPRYRAAFMLDRHEFLTHLGFWGFVAAILQFMAMPVGYGIRNAIIGFTDFFLSTDLDSRGVGRAAPRWPLNYSGVDNGRLERINLPPVGQPLPPYLIRWIGPGETAPSNALFVFRSEGGAASLEAQVEKAEADLRTAQSQEVSAQRMGRDEDVRTSRARADIARSNLAAARAKRAARDEPMLPDIQIDRDWPLAAVGKPVKEGESILLGAQMSSGAAILRLSISPEDAACIGTGMAIPQKRIRLRLKPDDGGKSIAIPVSAIQGFFQTPGAESATLVTDPAKGGFPLFKHDAHILITRDLLKIPNLVPPETLDYLARLNGNKATRLSSLEIDGFEEWRDADGHGHWDFVPYKEVLPKNVVMAMAELQSTRASPARMSTPEQTAAIDAGAIQSRIQTLQNSRQGLQRQIDLLPKRDMQAAQDRETYTNQLAAIDNEIQNLRGDLRMARGVVANRGEQGIQIGPRQLEVHQKGLWIFARDRIARLLNPWNGRNQKSNPPADAGNSGLLNMDPEALEQVSEENVTVVVRTSLQEFAQAGLSKFSILFPGVEKPDVFEHLFDSTITDPVQNLSKVGVNRTFTGAQARRRFPLPGSLVPVKFFLPEDAAIVKLPAAARADQATDDGAGLNRISKWAALLPAAFVAYFVYNIIRLRMRRSRPLRRDGPREKPEQEPATDYELISRQSGSDLDALRNARLSSERLLGMASDFKMHYLNYEYRDANGHPLKEPEVLYKKFGHTGIWRRLGEVRTMISEFHFRTTKEKYERKTVHMKVIVAFFASLTGLIYFASPGAKAFTLVKTAFWLGNFTWDKLRSDLARIDWHRLLTSHTFLTSPQSVVEAFIPLVILVGLILILGYAAGKMIAEIGAPLYGDAKEKWFRKVRETETTRERFRELTKPLNPKGEAMDPDIQIRRIRQDPEGKTDPERAIPQSAENFKAEVAALGRLLSERATIVLGREASQYIDEKPEDLDLQGTFFTEGRQKASQARWWAAVLENSALDQGTERALIPAGSGWENRLQYKPEYLELIAREILGMRENTIGEVRGIRDLLTERYPDPEERELHWKRIHQEYLDRALVWWAIAEMAQRPISSLIVMRAYDLVGIPCQATGFAEEDDAFRGIENELTTVLGELDLRLPTLSERAHRLQAEYSRQTSKFQLADYLAEGFTPKGRLNPDRQGLVLDSMVDEDHGLSLVRDRTEDGIRTFEALVMQFYVHGPWPQDMEDEVRRDYERLLNFSRTDAQTRVDQIEAILKGEPMRIFWAWTVAQRLQKSLPDNFDTLLAELRTTRSGQRNVSDLRWLSKPAPIMDESKRNEATNADLLIADLRGERRLQNLLSSGLAAKLPPMAAFVDPALEKNLREGAADLGFLSRFFRRKVHLSALAEVLDPYIARLSNRITSRLSSREGGNVHVFSKNQSGDILPRATRLFGDSVFLVSQEPSNFAVASDPDLSDPKMQVVSPCNPYIKYQALFIFFCQKLLDSGTLNPAQAEDIRSRQQVAIDELGRMNVAVFIGDWNQSILDHLVPAEDDDHSYNHVLIIRPGDRLLPSAPVPGGTIQPRTAHLEESEHLPRGARRLFGPILWGDKGALYQVKAGIEFSPHLDSGFLSLRDNQGRLLATSYYHSHTVSAGSSAVQAIYHSWLAVSLALRGLKLGSELAAKRLAWFAGHLPGRAFAYCFIDADNDRSITNVKKRGYEQVGEFVTSLVARSNPQDSPHMRKATTEDTYAILKLLEESYKGYALTDFDPETLDGGDSYYVWEEGHRIVAVINAKRQRWLFKRLMRKLFGIFPNIDVLAMPLIPYLPKLKKSFNLTNFSFLKLSSVAFAPGHAGDAVNLIEATIARRKVYDAWGFLDAKGPVYQDLKKAGAFGSPGILNAVQETKVGVYAKSFDQTGQDFLTETKKRPAFASKENLGWWLIPFVGLGSMLFGTAHKAMAAAVDTIAPMAHHVAQKAAEINIPTIVQKGDSWRRIAHHVMGSEQPYTHLMDINTDLVQKGVAHGNQFLIHAGDQINVGLTAHVPSTPVVSMHQIPMGGLDQWLLHPSLTPEVAWIALGTLLLIAGIWLWRHWRPLRQPLMVPLLAVVALAQSIVPGVFQPANRGTDSPPLFSRTSTVPDVRLETSEHVAGVKPGSSDASQNGVVDVSAPPDPIKVTPREVPAQAWVRYANDHLLEAAAAHAAGDDTAETRRDIDAIDISYLAQLRSLLASLKASAGSQLSEADRAAIDALEGELARQEQEAKDRVAQPPAASAERLPAVEQLRQEYIAGYALHEAEARTAQSLVTPAPVAHPARQGRLSRLGGAVKKLGAPALWVWRKASGPLIKLGTDKRPEPESFDPPLENVRAKVEALIRKTKLHEQIARHLLENADQALNAMTGTPQTIVEKAQRLTAERNSDVYKRLLEKTQERSGAVRSALAAAEAVPGLDPAKRFEIVFDTDRRWDQVPAGSDQLASDLAAVAARADSGIMPVKGTKHMKGREKRSALAQASEMSQATAASEAKQRNAAQTELKMQLALGQKLSYLGFPVEAYRTIEAALLFARAEELLPIGDQAFRDPQTALHLKSPSSLEKDNPTLWSTAQPLLDRSRSAENEFTAAVEDGVRLENEWAWKSKQAAAMNFDPLTLFPDLRSNLVTALRREAKARASLQSATQTLSDFQADHLEVVFDRDPMKEPAAEEPDEATQARYEQEIVNRRQTAEGATGNEQRGEESLGNQPTGIRADDLVVVQGAGNTAFVTRSEGRASILRIPNNPKRPATLILRHSGASPAAVAPPPNVALETPREEPALSTPKTPASRSWWSLPGVQWLAGLTFLSGVLGLAYRKLAKGSLLGILGPVALVGQLFYGAQQLRPDHFSHAATHRHSELLSRASA